ncbi:MAG: immunoglobulin-like domain-containing protein [Acutalibacteraceae bacterium]
MKKWKRVLLIVAVSVFTCVLCFVISLAAVIPKFQKNTVELGESVSTEPRDYLYGYSFIIANADIDTSHVDTTKVGQYEVHCDIWFYHYAFKINVVDTTAPTISASENQIYLASSREYHPEDFIDSVSDLSGDVQIWVDYGGKQYHNISFEILGQYTVAVTAKDASGNVSSINVNFTVDEAPVIIGVFDRHLVKGKNYDAGKSVVAIDNLDGNITEELKIDAAGLDTNTIGEYSVTYSVKDSYGLESSRTATIYICNENEIGNYNDERSISEEELELMCEAGYFKYEPLNEPDYDKTVSMIEPTLIDLKRNLSNGWVAGSGVIYKITPQYTYFLSVEHVLKTQYQGTDIMFFDGVKIHESFEYTTSDADNEMSMFKVKTADIPWDTLFSLKQIYVDYDIYSKLQVGDSVVAYAKHWLGRDVDLIRPMKVKKLTSSIKEFGLINSLLETSHNIVSGMSGTAVVDYKGNLVGLSSAAGLSSDNKSSSSYHSKIDCLKELEAKMDKEASLTVN